MGKKVLVVDDERLIVKGIKFSLVQDDMEVDCAYDGEEALEMAKKTEYDIVLLDVMLPKMDGFEVCQRIREFSNMPIIMLTAKGDDMDKILGLEYGADDYITKPYNTQILLARIEKILKRTYGGSTGGRILNYNDFSLNLSNATIEYKGKSTVLSKNELKILFFLMENKGTIVSRETLIGYLWKSDLFIDDSTLTVNMTRLRKRLEEVGIENPIETRRGLGYIMP